MFQSIQRKDFKPAWWCPGPHAQTIWRRVFGRTLTLSVERERWETPDNDFLDVDFLFPRATNDSGSQQPTVLFLHGLEGSSRSEYILAMLEGANRLGWRGVALNFRSCSGEINRQRRFYHSGETLDLDWVIRRLVDRYPKCSLGLVGFSLGGSVLLKWLGEQGDSVPSAVRASVAISVPYDLGDAARLIDRGFSRIYTHVFLKTLKQKAILKAQQYPGLIDPQKVARLSSFAEFDDLVTAPFHDFESGEDYWKQCSSRNFLHAIRSRTLLISAGDDPFLRGLEIPIEAVSRSHWLEGAFPQTGGHAGFIEGNWPWAAGYWADRRALSFLLTRLEERMP